MITMDRIRTRLQEDGGYVLALGALLMVPLLVATGFAVDVGSWYARASQLQKAADSAALGGVVWLPDQSEAEDAARAVLSRNGFPDADANNVVDGTDVSIQFTYPGAQQFQVRLVDADADTYFSGIVVTDPVDVTRQAVAEYVLPLAMGSPRNFLGTANDPGAALPGALHENFWLAISGPCAGFENGEPLQAITDQNYWHDSLPHDANPGVDGASVSWQGCQATNSIANPYFDPDGYFYAVNVPAGADGNDLYIDVYDPADCAGSEGNDPYETTFTTRGTDANPYDPTDNPTLDTDVFISNNSSAGVDGAVACEASGADYEAEWRRLSTVSSADAGVYFVQVQTCPNANGATCPAVSAAENHGSNYFSLRASYSSSWTEATSPCSSDIGDVTYYDDECPQVYAIDNMGVFANLTASVPQFYLTGVGDEHSGKVLEIDLFDPGEGAQALEILDPLGRSVDFDWEIVNPGSDVAPTGGWSGSVDQAGSDPFCTAAHPGCVELDVLGDPNGNCTTTQACYWRGWNVQKGPYMGSRSKYSARYLHIEVQLPADISAEYSGATWWQVRYTMGDVDGANTDRTMWSVTVTGDPVRLVE